MGHRLRLSNSLQVQSTETVERGDYRERPSIPNGQMQPTHGWLVLSTYSEVQSFFSPVYYISTVCVALTFY
jgi:hypothetical protein